MDDWAKYWAGKYSWALKYRADIDRDDLLQAARLGEYIAREKYSPEKGTFSTFSAFFIRKEIRRVIGIRDGQLPPIVDSLDRPLDGLEDETPLLETIADETLPDMDESINKEERRKGVLDAIERLQNQQQRAAMMMRYLDKKPVEAISEALGVSCTRIYQLFKKAQKNLRKDKLLRYLLTLEDEIPYYRHIGVKAFHSTNTSTVENAVLAIERKRENILCEYYAQEAPCEQ